MHSFLQTYQGIIQPTEAPCYHSEPDEALEIIIPQYENIKSIKILVNLQGGTGQVSFQPVGYSRPNSDCRGNKFHPPPNQDSKITYLQYNGILKNKQEYDLDEIKRAVVTYRLKVTVTQRTGYIIADGAQLLVPNVITIAREKEEQKEEKSRNLRKSIKEKAMEHLNSDLESYKDSVMGIFVLIKTGLPHGEFEK